MIRSRPHSTFLDPSARAAGLLGVAVLLALSIAMPRRARAQACCVATGLTTPARLRLYEDGAVGVQTRIRSVLGSFDARGNYVPAPAGDHELDAEEDLFVAKRFGPHWQISLQVPFVQTARSAGSVSGWGGGLGDVSANARWDVLIAGDRPGQPGIALLAGVTPPSGRSQDASSDPSNTAATGTGAWQGNLGLSVEPVFGRWFASVSAWVGQRTSTTEPIVETFAPTFTQLLEGGYTFVDNRSIGGFLQAMQQGNARDARGSVAGSAVGLFTGGVAFIWPFGSDEWRLQSSAAADLPLDNLGRNHSTGVSVTAAVVRAWM